MATESGTTKQSMRKTIGFGALILLGVAVTALLLGLLVVNDPGSPSPAPGTHSAAAEPSLHMGAQPALSSSASAVPAPAATAASAVPSDRSEPAATANTATLRDTLMKQTETADYPFWPRGFKDTPTANTVTYTVVRENQLTGQMTDGTCKLVISPARGGWEVRLDNQVAFDGQPGVISGNPTPDKIWQQIREFGAPADCNPEVE